MRLIAQSQIPTTPLPYMHLGYAAAIGLDRANFGLVLIVTVWIFGLLYLKGNIRKSRWVLPSVAAGIALMTWFGLHEMHEGQAIHYRTMTRSVYMVSIISRIRESIYDGNGYPTSLIELQQMMGDYGRYVFDSWGHPLRYSHHPTKNGIAFSLQSAGPDGIFDTSDDLRRQWAYDSGAQDTPVEKQ
jgi:hypothetical protein